MKGLALPWAGVVLIGGLLILGAGWATAMQADVKSLGSARDDQATAIHEIRLMLQVVREDQIRLMERFGIARSPAPPPPSEGQR